MDQLYVEIELRTENDETAIYTTVESFMALYIYRYLGKPSHIELKFVSTSNGTGELQLRSETLRAELNDAQILCKGAATHTQQAIKDLRLPVYSKGAANDYYIAGMCAVCRELVARCHQKNPDRALDKLLGFKGSCLLAPAETSIWTKFCELDVVAANSALLQKQLRGESLEELPQVVPRFERHMNEPVRMHNIYKLAREQATNKTTDIGATPKEELPIEHRFAEGIAFTIADLLLYPAFRLIFQHCEGMLADFPLLHTWLNEIDAFEPKCVQTLGDLLHLQTAMSSDASVKLRIPDCDATSLYKSDPKRYKPRARIYTHQSEVDACMAKLQTLQLDFTSDSPVVYDSGSAWDWCSKEPELALSSALPPARLLRKQQQLGNVANAVFSLSQSGERIVDFCSGSGHLGILLAQQLPDCTIVFIENKAISLERAKRRGTALGLTNCRYYQCNIDYFEGQFAVGTSLHACGTATDIVLQQCRRVQAQFACCPCCYGALQPMPHIEYPLSRRLRDVLDEREYLHIAHCADQAHQLGTANCRPETTRQGQLCMDIVDTDRKLRAEEAGYDVLLTRLKPEDCTPKNRLLVGRHLEHAALAS